MTAGHLGIDANTSQHMFLEVGKVGSKACRKLTVSISHPGCNFASVIWSDLLEPSGNDSGVGQ